MYEANSTTLPVLVVDTVTSLLPEDHIRRILTVGDHILISIRFAFKYEDKFRKKYLQNSLDLN